MINRKYQLNVIYSGKVQGVGFRYTARNFAIKHGITGWVKNLENGDVELLGQGNKSDLENMLNDINLKFQKNIADKTVELDCIELSYMDFSILH